MIVDMARPAMGMPGLRLERPFCGPTASDPTGAVPSAARAKAGAAFRFGDRAAQQRRDHEEGAGGAEVSGHSARGAARMRASRLARRAFIALGTAVAQIAGKSAAFSTSPPDANPWPKAAE